MCWPGIHFWWLSICFLYLVQKHFLFYFITSCMRNPDSGLIYNQNLATSPKITLKTHFWHLLRCPLSILDIDILKLFRRLSIICKCCGGILRASGKWLLPKSTLFPILLWLQRRHKLLEQKLHWEMGGWSWKTRFGNFNNLIAYSLSIRMTRHKFCILLFKIFLHRFR